jgi:hypothetical protein
MILHSEPGRCSPLLHPYPYPYPYAKTRTTAGHATQELSSKCRCSSLLYPEVGVPAHVGLVRLFLYPPILFPDACPGSVKFEPVQALCCPMLFCSSWSRAEGLESLTAHQSVTSRDSRECDSSRNDGDTTHKPCHTCAPLHQTCTPSCLGVPPVVRISHRFILAGWPSGSKVAAWPPRGGAPCTRWRVFHRSLLTPPRRTK